MPNLTRHVFTSSLLKLNVNAPWSWIITALQLKPQILDLKSEKIGFLEADPKSYYNLYLRLSSRQHIVNMGCLSAWTLIRSHFVQFAHNLWYKPLLPFSLLSFTLKDESFKKTNYSHLIHVQLKGPKCIISDEIFDSAFLEYNSWP